MYKIPMMNLRKSLLTLSIAFALSPAYGQLNTEKEEKPYIEVTGVAELEVIPDEIYIAIEIRERKEKTSVMEQEEKLKAVIKNLGLSFSDLQLSDAQADYVALRRKSGTILSGKNYTLKVANAATVGLLFRELDKMEITDAHIARLDHSRMDSLRKAVRINAIKAAKSKAGYLLEAIGEHTGKPLVIHENEQMPMTQTNYSRNQFMANTSYDESNTKWKQEVEFQKIKISASVYIKFAIQ